MCFVFQKALGKNNIIRFSKKGRKEKNQQQVLNGD